MKTATISNMVWKQELDESGKWIIGYTATGPGYVARVSIDKVGDMSWNASVEFDGLPTMRTAKAGYRTSFTCQQWARGVVRKFA